MSLARIREHEDKGLGWRFEKKDGKTFWKVLVSSVMLKNLLIVLNY